MMTLFICGLSTSDIRRQAKWSEMHNIYLRDVQYIIMKFKSVVFGQ